jgi:hypothetical protein
MLTEYKGFEIKAERQMSLGGDENLYFYIMRQSDGWFMTDSFTSGEDEESDFIGYLKNRVDQYLDDPTGECDYHHEDDPCSACKVMTAEK